MTGVGRVVILSGAILVVLARPAGAQPRRADGEAAATPLRISGVGECPPPDAMVSTIESLIPQHMAEVARRDPEVTVTDAGDSYRVRVAVDGHSHVRIYRDVGRDCAHRARVAAVFVVLTLLPPEVMMESPPPAPAPPPPPPPPPPIVVAPAPIGVSPEWRLSLAVAAVLDVAPALGDAASSASPGGEVRVGLRKRRVGGEVGLGVQPRSDFAVAGVSARERRLPFDVSAVFRQPLRAIELAAAVGVAGAIFNAEGLNPAIPSGGTRLDVGGRAALELRVGGSSSRGFGAFLGAHALYFPRPYDLATTPTGVVGKTPSLWIGANLGAVVSF